MIQTNFGKLPIQIVGDRGKVVRSGAGASSDGQAASGKRRVVKPSDLKRPPIAEEGAGWRNPASAPVFASRLELHFANYLAGLEISRQIRGYWYQPFSLKLPGERMHYRPDFLVLDPDGRVIIYEVKGWSKNQRDGLTHVRVAAGLTPWARFVLVTRERDRRWRFRNL